MKEKFSKATNPVEEALQSMLLKIANRDKNGDFNDLMNTVKEELHAIHRKIPDSDMETLVVLIYGFTLGCEWMST